MSVACAQVRTNGELVISSEVMGAVINIYLVALYKWVRAWFLRQRENLESIVLARQFVLTAGDLIELLYAD
jgi:hypothetical protein